MKKKIFYILLFIVLCIIPSQTFAEELPFRYGVYCDYGDFWFSYGSEYADSGFQFESSEKWTVDKDGNEIFAGNAVTLPTMPSDFTGTKQDWLVQIGLATKYTNGNYYFNCPTYNPFGTTGTLKKKVLGENSGLMNNMEEMPIYNYTCTYKGQKSGSTLIIEVTEDDTKINNVITYPDGSKASLKSGLVYDTDCSQDIYYIASEKKINWATYSNMETHGNNTLLHLCRDYTDDEIEHFCSGNCEFEELVCSSGGPVTNNCEGILGDELINFINKIFRWIQILAPIFVIIISAVDFTLALLQDDKDAMKKATSKLIKRLIIAVVLFFVPMILSWLLNIFNDITGAASSTCGIGE